MVTCVLHAAGHEARRMQLQVSSFDQRFFCWGITIQRIRTFQLSQLSSLRPKLASRLRGPGGRRRSISVGFVRVASVSPADSAHSSDPYSIRHHSIARVPTATAVDGRYRVAPEREFEFAADDGESAGADGLCTGNDDSVRDVRTRLARTRSTSSTERGGDDFSTDSPHSKTELPDRGGVRQSFIRKS